MKHLKWKLVAVLILGVLGAAARLFGTSPGADPLVSGKRVSEWLAVVESEKPGSLVSNEAVHVLLGTTEKAALQAQILNRIERRYSPLAEKWYRLYFGLPRPIRKRVPQPQFGRIRGQTVAMLEGVSTNPSPRQKADIETIIRYGAIADVVGIAYGVALSEATQTPPEAISFVRRELSSADSNRRFGVCEALRTKRGLESWRAHAALVAGLKQDLSKVSTSDPDPLVAKAAAQALGNLEFELGARSPVTNQERTNDGNPLLAPPVSTPTQIGVSRTPLNLKPQTLSTELRMELSPSQGPKP